MKTDGIYLVPQLFLNPSALDESMKIAFQDSEVIVLTAGDLKSKYEKMKESNQTYLGPPKIFYKDLEYLHYLEWFVFEHGKDNIFIDEIKTLRFHNTPKVQVMTDILMKFLK